MFDFTLHRREKNTRNCLLFFAHFICVFWSFFLKKSGKWEKKIINYLLTQTQIHIVIQMHMYKTRLKVDPSSSLNMLLFLYDDDDDENRLFKKHYLIFFSLSHIYTRIFEISSDYIFFCLYRLLHYSSFSTAAARKKNNSKKFQNKFDLFSLSLRLLCFN